MKYTIRLDGEPRMPGVASILHVADDYEEAIETALDWLSDPPVKMTITGSDARTLIVEAVKG